VADEGPGIPEELRPKLFAPCRTTKPGGSGIGLAISQQLAHHLGAELELKQTGPAGAVFTLTLPAALLGQKRGALGAQTAGAPDRGTTTAA
jgi:C4-dicarboxylate-specific signal transduction histidine kinase